MPLRPLLDVPDIQARLKSTERALPDIILADAAEPFLLVFVEVVATNGAINASRREALLALARENENRRTACPIPDRLS